MSQNIKCPHCQKEFPMEEGLKSHLDELRDTTISKAQKDEEERKIAEIMRGEEPLADVAAEHELVLAVVLVADGLLVGQPLDRESGPLERVRQHDVVQERRVFPLQ